VLVPGTQTIDTVKKTVTVTISGFSVYRMLATVQAASDLSNVIVYPNPFKPAAGLLTFKGLTVNATIKIYNIAGELVAAMGPDKTGSTGKYEWSAVNDTGENVASGVYLYVVTDPANHAPAKGKFALIR
jgi:hypothetical protein